MHVVDVAGSEGRDPVDDIQKINEELKKQSEELASRPQIIVANKTDLLYEDHDYSDFEKFVDENEWELLYVSAATGEGLDKLVHLVSERLSLLPPLTFYESEITPEDEYAKSDSGRETTIRRENDTPLIKRVIGLPGDNIYINDHTGRVYRDGDELDESYVRGGFTPSKGLNEIYVVPEDGIFVLVSKCENGFRVKGDGKSAEIFYDRKIDFFRAVGFLVAPRDCH